MNTTLLPNNAALRLLIATLRSGKYQQTKGRLRETIGPNGEQGYCCLGVACDLFDSTRWREEFPREWVYSVAPNMVVGIRTSGTVLPDEVCRHYGFEIASGIDIRSIVIFGKGKVKEILESLSSLNDSGMSFAHIADLIEWYFDLQEKPDAY